MVLGGAIRLLRHSRSMLVTGGKVLLTNSTHFAPASMPSSVHASIAHRFFRAAGSPLFSDRRYTDKHEWVLLDGETAVVGISNYAQEALGDVVFAQLPDVGTVLTQKDECGALESVKAASELFSPISGTVVAKNEAVEESPALINTSCYDKGWLFKVRYSSKAEVDALMVETAYEAFLKSADH